MMRTHRDLPAVSWRTIPTLILISVLAGGCPPPVTEDDPRLPLGQQLLQSPCDTRRFYAFAERVAGDTLFMVSALDLPESEVHDCQRLITNGQLGPLVALLVSTNRVQFANFANGEVVAEIVNYGPAYEELGIHSGLNCLWIRGGADGWVGAIVPPNGNCATTVISRPAPEQMLTVARITHEDAASPNLYPSTGRWMWDGRHQYIGIRCGNAWCELGRRFTRTGRIQHVADVPGWFDEQLLSYGPPGALRLSTLLGRITPAMAPGQDMPRDDAFETEQGLQTATLHFSGGDETVRQVYRDKFGIQGTALTVPLYHHRHPVSKVLQYRTNGGWVGGVYYNQHNRHAGAGAVRWAWSERDEQAWYPCTQGCCTTDALQ